MSSSMELDTLAVSIYKEDGVFVARSLEHDMVAMGGDAR